MRVTFNSFYNTLSDRFGNLNTMQQTALQQMSTGQKLTVPSDDPTAMQRVLELRTSKAQETQFWRNSGDVTSISKVSTSDLSQLNDISSRVGELTTLGASDLNGTANFSAYASETDQILRQALTQANSRLNGKYLHGGTVTATPPFVAYSDAAGTIPIAAGDSTTPIALVKYAGNNVDATVRVSEDSAVLPYTNGAENQNVCDLLNNMVALRDGLAAKDPAVVKALRPAQEAIEDKLLSSISRAGAVQYRLEVSTRQSTERFQADEALISRDADVDMSEASVRFSRAQTAYSAAIQSGAKIANKSLLDYI
jgi:flagellar hook-associated protein 3 FlgL